MKDEDKVPQELKSKYTEQIMDLVLYDVESCKALQNFEVVQRNTHCTFAKMSKLWGSYDFDKSLSVGKLLTSMFVCLMHA